MSCSGSLKAVAMAKTNEGEVTIQPASASAIYHQLPTHDGQLHFKVVCNTPQMRIRRYSDIFGREALVQIERI